MLSERIRGRAIVRVQNPVDLSELSEPQPDLALLRPRADYYEAAHPGPDDVLLLVEVADSSLDYDRDVKASLYASASVPEVWIVDLSGGRVVTYRSPGPDGYAEVREIGAGDRVTPVAFPDLVIEADDILGS